MHRMQLLFNLEIVFEKEIEMLHIVMFFKTMQNEDNYLLLKEEKRTRILQTSVSSYH